MWQKCLSSSLLFSPFLIGDSDSLIAASAAGATLGKLYSGPLMRRWQSVQRRYGFTVEVEVRVSDGDGGGWGGVCDAAGNRPDSQSSGMEF